MRQIFRAGTRAETSSKRATSRAISRRAAAFGIGFAVAVLAIPSAVTAQACTPSTIPCQTCPPPPPCTPSSTPCVDLGGGSGNTTFTTSTSTCGGAFTQSTVTTVQSLGPGTICVGPDRSVSCVVTAGTTNINTHTDTIVGGVAVPALSLWALGGLAVVLGALALRRLAPPPG